MKRTVFMGAIAGFSIALTSCGESGESGSGTSHSTSNEEAGSNMSPASQQAGGSAPIGAAPANALTLADGPDVCFREIEKKFGRDLKVSEINSYFSAGQEIDSMSRGPRGVMRACSVKFQNPQDPRKLMSAIYDTNTRSFGQPTPMEITVFGGNAANFRLDDYVIPLSRIDTTALKGLMDAQEPRLKKVYGDYAWSGVRLSSPGAFSKDHLLRIDVDGRLAANDIKESGYATVSLDGKRIVRDDLLP